MKRNKYAFIFSSFPILVYYYYIENNVSAEILNNNKPSVYLRTYIFTYLLN